MKDSPNVKKLDLQTTVIESFTKRFAPGAVVAHVSPETRADRSVPPQIVRELVAAPDKNCRLPDVILYHPETRWLYFVEIGQHITPARAVELRETFADCAAGLSLVSAFPDRTAWEDCVDQIAWGTAVWIAEIPDHLIHYNGDRFIGPR